MYFNTLALQAFHPATNLSTSTWPRWNLLQEFLKMMTHKILNRDPKDEILKVRPLISEEPSCQYRQIVAFNQKLTCATSNLTRDYIRFTSGYHIWSQRCKIQIANKHDRRRHFSAWPTVTHLQYPSMTSILQVNQLTSHESIYDIWSYNSWSTEPWSVQRQYYPVVNYASTTYAYLCNCPPRLV